MYMDFFCVGIDIYDDRKMMVFDICFLFGYIIEMVLKINLILNNFGVLLFIVLFFCYCNCIYKILVVLIEIILKFFVL